MTNLSKKLRERISELEKQPGAIGGSSSYGVIDSNSPIPSPDYDAPSPEASDEMELRLPDEDQGPTSSSVDLSSRLDSMRGTLSKVIKRFDVNVQKIPSNKDVFRANQLKNQRVILEQPTLPNSNNSSSSINSQTLVFPNT